MSDAASVRRRRKRRQERLRRERQLRIRMTVAAVAVILALAGLFWVIAGRMQAGPEEDKTPGGQSAETVAAAVEGSRTLTAEDILRAGDRLYLYPQVPTAEESEQVRAVLGGLEEEGLHLMPVPSAACVDRPEGMTEPDAEREALEAVLEDAAPGKEALSAYDRFLTLLAGEGEEEEGGENLPPVRFGPEDKAFFRTAPWLTPAGAGWAYTAAAEVLGIENPASTCDTIIVENSFRGPLAQASGEDLKEDLSLVLPGEDMRILVTETDSDGGAVTTGSVYREEILDSADPWQVFLGGKSLAVIRNADAESGSLILVTDRVSVPVTVYLAEHYREITVVLPEGNLPAGAETLQKIRGENDAEVLILCAAQTLLNDEGMTAFLMNGGE